MISESKYIRMSDDVAGALAAGGPVVALESTLITHGLPAPVNLETAVAMEQEVRSAGATPATICLIDGVIRVGLSQSELDRLAGSSDAIKVSSRGIAYAAAMGRTAGTTVSGTMWIASRVGIEVFGTGGVGGVHRGASESGDISTDLQQLARTPVAVVSAGVKSILDIGRTLEFLETVGVPVFGYQTDEFPAFFSGTSGFAVPWRIANADEAARVWRVHRDLGLETGAVFACPPPGVFNDPPRLEAAIEQANQDAIALNVSGGDVTPFVLQRIAELTDDESVRVNIALLRNNARIAGEIAVALRRVDVAPSSETGLS
jgi:pseudouridylate synthase